MKTPVSERACLLTSYWSERLPPTTWVLSIILGCSAELDEALLLKTAHICIVVLPVLEVANQSLMIFETNSTGEKSIPSSIYLVKNP